MSRAVGVFLVLDSYPGNLSVLFIEYTKCFPKDVNRSGR